MTPPQAPDLRLETLIRKEWLLPNGRGGYASGTYSGINTRKYHGLLISGFEDRGSRCLYAGTLEEKLIIGDHRFFFSAHKYTADAIYPRGFMHLLDYGQAPGLVWFRFGNFHDHDLNILKVIRVCRGYEAVEMEYFVTGDLQGVSLTVFPLMTTRNIHQVMTQAPYHSERGEEWTGALPFVFERVEATAGGWHGLSMKNRVNDRKCLILSSASEYTDEQDWYHSFQYDKELERGYEYVEDLYCPGKFAVGGDQLTRPFRLVFSLVPDGTAPGDSIPEFAGRDVTCQEAFRLFPADQAAPEGIIERWHQKLSAQAEDFWVDNPNSHTGIIAGYPWFGLWSRDMLQSMEGLLLVPGRYERARDMLLSLAGQSRDGLIPNILEESDLRYEFLGDSSLWYIFAVYQYLQATSDRQTLEQLWPVMQQIIIRYLRPEGAHPIMDEDGLIVLVSDGSRAATWMDAIVSGRAVTPRYGKPVEIQALWYNVLCMLDSLSREHHLEYPLALEALRQRGFATLGDLCTHVQKSFITQYIHRERGYLADVVGEGGTSWQVRPNQLFACGLPFPLLSRAQTKTMLTTVDSELLTPWGLRTLSNLDPEYRGSYGGSQNDRDRAYHQGTVWPWLLGMYTRTVRYALDDESAAGRIESLLEGLFAHLESLRIEYIPEVFGADDGHPDGTFHQAWSIAEILGMMAVEQTARNKTKKQPKRRKNS